MSRSSKPRDPWPDDLSPEDYTWICKVVASLRSLEARERAAAIEGACAEHPELRKVVQEMLEPLDDIDLTLAGQQAVAAAASTFLDPCDEAPTLPRFMGRYEALKQIHGGGMGIVYKGFDPEVARPVALKLPLPALRNNADIRSRFVQEVRLAGSLRNDLIAAAYDTGMTDDGPFLVMEFVDGQQLTAWLSSSRPFSERLHLFLLICDAVMYAHGKMIVHRDLKAANVLVDGSGLPKLLDFGIAERIPEAGAETRGAPALGTPGWRAPEQATHPDLVTERIDVHGLGRILEYLLPEGLGPSSGDTNSNSAPRRVLPLDVPGMTRRELAAIVAKATAPDRQHRHSNVASLRADVQAVLESQPVAALRETLTDRAGAWYAGRKLFTRRRNGILLGGAVFTLLSGLGAYGMGAELRARREAREGAEIAEYVVRFFEMSGADRDGVPVGDGWRLLDHAYRGIQRQRAPNTNVSTRLLLTMGRAYLAAGIPTRASHLFGDAVANCDADDSIPRERCAEALDLLARASLAEGELALARANEAKALAIRAGLFGPDSVECDESRVHLAAILAAEGQLSEARALLMGVVATREAQADHSKPKLRSALADALEQLALVEEQQANNEGAVLLLGRALDIRNEQFDGSNPVHATTRLRLGRALMKSRRPTEAEPLLREALGMRRDLFSVNGPAPAEALSALAEACLAQERPVEAALHASDCLALWMEFAGDEDARTIEAGELLDRIRRSTPTAAAPLVEAELGSASKAR